MQDHLTRAIVLSGAVALFLASTTGMALAQKEQPRPDVDRMQQQLRNRMDLMRRILEQQQRLLGQGLDMPDLPGLAPFNNRPVAREATREARLGVDLAQPSSVLVDQLDLPKNQGLVLEEVGANSAAGKAGLKKNDILLELGGKSVPNKVSDFRRMIAGIKPDAAVDLVVMRKGKKETVKGVTLPEAKAEPAPRGLGLERGLLDFPNLRNLDNGNLERLLNQGAMGGSTTITRTNDQFTVRHKDGTATLSITGSIDQGKTKIATITIDDGKAKKEYPSIDKVPDLYRKRVRDLVGLVDGGEAEKDDL